MIPTQFAGRVQTHSYGRERIAMQERITEHALVSARFEVTPDMYSRDMIARLSTWVAANTVHEDSTTTTDTSKPEEIDRKTKTLTVPLSWWDHVKHDFCQRWPKVKMHWRENTITTTERVYMQTKMTTINNKTVHMCPHLQADRDVTHVRWLEGLEPPKNSSVQKP